MAGSAAGARVLHRRRESTAAPVLLLGPRHRRAAGQSPLLLRACAALELLHAFALIHDDLMDQSATRRGRPALHREIAGQHRRHRWAGDPEAYGHAAALLTGDLAFALASRLSRHAARPRPADLGPHGGRADHGSVPRPGRRCAGGPVGRGRADHRPAEVGAVHGHGTAAARRRAGRGRRAACCRRAPTAISSARRSSSATTCSACSETRAGRESPSVKTSGPASPPT